MPLEAHGPAPYTTAASAVAAIEAFRDRGMGTPITPETLIRAGIKESLAPRTLSALRLLDLVTDAGEPTDVLTDLKLARGTEEYKARLQEWLRSAYGEVLLYTNPETDPPDRVAEAFRTYEPAAQRRAMAALLIGLWKHAGLPVPEGAPPLRSPTVHRSGKAKTSAGASSRARGFKTEGTTPNVPADLPPGLVGLIQQIPRGGAGWTKAQRDSFVRAFEAALDFIVPVEVFASESAVGGEAASVARDADTEDN